MRARHDQVSARVVVAERQSSAATEGGGPAAPQRGDHRRGAPTALARDQPGPPSAPPTRPAAMDGPAARGLRDASARPTDSPAAGARYNHLFTYAQIRRLDPVPRARAGRARSVPRLPSLDSSFLSLPEIDDILLIWMVTQHKSRMLLYAAERDARLGRRLPGAVLRSAARATQFIARRFSADACRAGAGDVPALRGAWRC